MAWSGSAFRWAWRCAWAWGPALAALAGCSTMSQDLGSLGDAITPVTPVEAARMMMDPYDPDNRRKGTVLISNSPFGGADAYLSVYRDYVVNERDPLVRSAAICALGRHGKPSDAPPIAACLVVEHEQVRWEAAKALQRLHNPAVVTDLLRTVRDPLRQPDTRVAAAIALGQYPQDRVFHGLVGALDATPLALNLAAEDSLHILTGKDFGIDSNAWLRWYASAATPFADGVDYFYPTYQRKETWLEKLAFWSSTTYEQPAKPAGLEGPDRQTYQDDHEARPDETGG